MLRTVSLLMFCLSLILICSKSSKAQGIWRYDTSSYFNSPGGDAFSALTIEGKIYTVGFCSVRIFDPSSDSWSIPKSASYYIPSPGDDQSAGFQQGTAVELGGKIYAFGGYHYDMGPTPNTLHILDLSSLTWSEPEVTGSFTPREDLSSCVVGGKIYAIGGSVEDGDLNDHIRNVVEVFDPITLSWSRLITHGSLIGDVGQTASLIGNKIYVIGGDAPNQVLDLETMIWSTFNSKGYAPRWFQTATVLEGKLYVIGGAYHGSIAAFRRDSVVQVYDPAADTWTTPMTSGLFYPQAMMVSTALNGSIYVMGGGDEDEAVSVFTPGTLAVRSTKSPEPGFKLRSQVVTDRIIVNTEQNIGTIQISICDALGRTVLAPREVVPSNGDCELDISGLPPGMYDVLINLPSGTTALRVLKL